MSNRLTEANNAMIRAANYRTAAHTARSPFVGSPVNHQRVNEVDGIIRATTGIMMTAKEFDTAVSMVERARAWRE